MKNKTYWIWTAYFFFLPILLNAQSLEGQIEDSISRLIIILNLLLVAAIAWSGFLLAKGDHHGISRLIYCVIGLVVVNSAQMIINFFR